MSLNAILADLVDVLDAASIPYMVTGSVASSIHGEPRSTQDIDIVVQLDGASLARLLRHLPDDRFYVSADAARDAVLLLLRPVPGLRGPQLRALAGNRLTVHP